MPPYTTLHWYKLSDKSQAAYPVTNVIDDSTIVYPTGQSDCYCSEKQSEDGWNVDYYVEGHSRQLPKP